MAHDNGTDLEFLCMTVVEEDGAQAHCNSIHNRSEIEASEFCG